jgi:2-dehydro-3-deoxyphosphogalactonate aldolase
VIARAKRHGLLSVPGCFTPSEAFGAIRAGADALKLFPAQAAGVEMLRALRAVLPRELPVLAVGGVTVESMGAWWAAGARGFGVGAALYTPGRSADEVATRAQAFVQAARALKSPG